MIRTFLARLLPATATCLLFASKAFGQTVPPDENARSFPFGYTLAFLATILIMVILCSPSRKKGS